MELYRCQYLCNVQFTPEKGLTKFLSFHDTPYKPGDLMIKAWEGDIKAESPEGAAEKVFVMHNQDDRPTGQVCPSMSIGDVAVVNDQAYVCLARSWQPVPMPTNFFSGSWADIVELISGGIR